VTGFLHVLTDRSVRLLPVSAAGVMLADPRGEPRVAAASSMAAGLIELFQVQNDEGPCLDCFRTGRPVIAAYLAGPDQRWPRFSAARRVGVSLYAGDGERQHLDVYARRVHVRQPVLGVVGKPAFHVRDEALAERDLVPGRGPLSRQFRDGEVLF
jgi:hypothetical protein